MSFVEVTPLHPPFSGDVLFLEMDDQRVLALSLSDGDRLMALLGGSCEGRRMVVERSDGDKIRISVLH